MGSVGTKIGNAVETSDIFATPIMLRYQTDDNKPSKTGGIISIILILVMLVFFYQSWYNVLNKKSVKAEKTTITEIDPSSITFTDEDFTLVIGLSFFNLSESDRYFDFQVSYHVRNGSDFQTIIVAMQSCKRDFFVKMGSDFEQIYDRLQLSKFLCFPPGFTGTLGGKFASEVFQYLRIGVTRCNISSPGCKSDADLASHFSQFQNFLANFYFVNRLINPTELQPISTYFEDRNYNYITSTMGITTNVYISQYTINTDNSLWPWENIQVDTNIFIDRSSRQNFIYPLASTTYVRFYFRKSDQKEVIKRNYRKIDDLLSYLGGLFGIITLVFSYIIIHYNQCCFQLELCNRVFSDQQKKQKINGQVPQQTLQNQESDEQIKKQKIKNSLKQIKFNFFTYLKYVLYLFITQFFENFQWKKMERIKEKLEETRNQMNIDVILHKLTIHEKSLECIFDEDEVLLLYLQEKISLDLLRERRQLMTIQQDVNQKNNKIANQFILNILGEGQSINMSRRKTTRKQSIVNLQAMDENFFDKNLDAELKAEVFKSLEEVERRAKQGNKVSERILEGVREDILKEYEKKKTKNRNINMRTAMFFSELGAGLGSPVNNNSRDEFLEAKYQQKNSERSKNNHAYGKNTEKKKSNFRISKMSRCSDELASSVRQFQQSMNSQN